MDQTNSKKRKTTEDRLDDRFPTTESALEYIKELEGKLEEAEQRAKKAESKLLKFEEEKSAEASGSIDDDSDDDEDDPTLNSNDPWMLMYQQMREYRIIHGHCRVPMKFPQNPKLGWWVANQRKARKASGSAKKMSPDRIALMDAIDFVWGKDSKPVPWDERYQELVKFRQNVGHCNIPFNTTCPSALACWVAAQRAEYKRFKSGRDSLLTLDQIGKLNEIKFSWKSPKTK